MTLTLRRKPSTPYYTEGELFHGEKKICDTLEDTQRTILRAEDKVKGKTAIPGGRRYRLQWTKSPRFKRYLIEVCNVPWFEGIRIHAGNTANDTSGCILVGQKYTDGKLTMSRITLEKVNTMVSSAILRGESVFLMIE